MIEFFATAARGTEGALRDELRELRVRGVRADRGGVHFAGEWHDGWRVCLGSRIAVRVLAVQGRFACRDERALYDGVRAIEWGPFLTPHTTLAVSATCKSSALTHTQYIAQKTKDAVVDQLRDNLGARPSVDLRDPDVRLSVHIAKDEATVYLDLSGEPLHRRGYRAGTVEAPLKETLAAAILRLAGWDRAQPLLDPMCGGGTFLVEAAQWSRAIAPGLGRHFGFERWASFDAGAKAKWSEQLDKAREAVKTEGPEIVGCDVDPDALRIAEASAYTAKVPVRLEQRDVAESEPLDPPGFVVTNPPYDERLPAQPELYRAMYDAFERMPGHAVAVLSGSPMMEKAIPRRFRSHQLFNGDIECRLLRYDIP